MKANAPKILPELASGRGTMRSMVEGPLGLDASHPSFRRRPESSRLGRMTTSLLWIPAFAGMTDRARPAP
jgi:hypothetical protein